MLVNKAIVLAAGKGTRMGPLGEKLAKPMWPFFGLTLLDIQLLFLKKQFGIETVYLNSHHLYEQLADLDSENVKVVYEPDLLDQGGGILNICEQFGLFEVPLIINNADQFYFFDKRYFDDSLESIKSDPITLFGLKVDKSDGYNKLNIGKKSNLIEITQNKYVEDKSFSTYSGLSLLSIPNQSYDNKPVSFFDSVANFQRELVKVKEVPSGEYFDFGKLSEYYDLCFETKKLLDKGLTNSLIDLIQSSSKFRYIEGEGLNFSKENSEKAKDGEIILDQGKIIKKDGALVSSL
ncbi:MAG: NDP-sugar pyrophosphorylase family protein [Bacteriovoracaceae bacterium]|jgi:NDP-sugar pyrophosphorylase family protein